MATAHDTRPGDQRGLHPRSIVPHWDRPDRRGLALSILIPLIAVVAGNGLLVLVGDGQNPDYEAVAWNPPGWLIGAIWCVIYPLWGAARWKVATANDARAGRSWWVAGLIVWALCYPVIVSFTGTLGSAVVNALSLLLAIVTVIRVWPVSKAAVVMIAPSVVWLIVANALGLAALEMAG